MAAATASHPQTMGGHPIAMKVGGRRLSVSKSPPVKSYLSTSPTATKDNTKSNEATDYPRPEGGETKHDEKEGKHEDKEGNKQKKEKPAFDQIKQKHANVNPANNNNFSIKQPSGMQH